MNDISWGEIIKRNKELGLKMSGPLKKIALLSNTTIFQLKDILELELRKLDINVEIDLGDYDLIVQDSNNFKNHDAVIIFWEQCNLIDGFNYKDYSLSNKKLDSLISKVESEIKLTLENLKKTPLVLINKFTSLNFDSNALEQSKQSLVSDRLNNFLRNTTTKNQLVVNIEKIISVTGIGNAIDYRQFQSSKSLYTKDFYLNYVEYIKSAFLASNGIVKKVLVLDCDNTLWGGILGEDGEDMIQMNSLSNKGKSFQEVQHILRSYNQKGILLALCSKNNLADVDSVLDNHKDMILKKNDFVAKKVNWTDKAQNLIDISNELNIGLESFIFVDDSEFEIGLIREELPQVKSVLVPKDLSTYPEIIRSLERDLFSFSLTKEDSDKTSMYIQESQRKEAKQTFNSIDNYLKSLGLYMHVAFDEDISIERSAQMTQKTNQFNLRTKRYTESEIQNFINSKKYIITTFSLGDMYGDYGITGLCIISIESNIAFIDTFLMSCRVIGRNVEFSFFAQIIKKLIALKNKKLIIEAEWISTPKNNQVANLYESLGFECIAEASESKSYRLSLSKYISNEKDYIKILK